MRAHVVGLAVLTTLAFAEPALAQSAEDLAAAERLFRQARELMQANDYDKACPMFAESARLDRQPGTLLNLGLCYEAQAKTASAWGAFSQAAIEATRKGQPERAQFAKEHASALEPKLSYVKIVLQHPARSETISLDGRAIGEGSLVTSLPMDPGEHALEASAPGKIARKQKFVVPEGPSSQEVSVASLVDAPTPPPTTIVYREEANDGSTQRTLGWVVGGVGVAGLATGAVLGVLYLGKASDNNDTCVGDPAATNGVLCTPQQVADANDTRSTAKTYGLVSTISLGVGVVGVAAGTYLVLTSRKHPKSGAASLQITPALGPREQGVMLGGAF